MPNAGSPRKASPKVSDVSSRSMTVEALLVIGATANNELAPETTVEVTVTVQQAFDLEDVEGELDVDLDDALSEAWDQEPYVVADTVEVLDNVDRLARRRQAAVAPPDDCSPAAPCAKD